MHFEEYKARIAAEGKLPEDAYVIGIDLGTTNSVISYWDSANNRPEPIDISNGFGKIPMPSVVQYRKEEAEWVIGDEAYRSMKLYPESTVRSIKRKMGTNEQLDIAGNAYLPEDISAMILKELVSNVYNLNPKAEIAGIVVSVPYDFDDAAKKATMRACEIAGLSDHLICLIEEPKAAALAYNFRHMLKADENILVFDFGGGTLDITIFKVTEQNDNHIKMQVICEGGEAFHGGDNVDEMLLEHCYNLLEAKTKTSRNEVSPENLVELSMRARDTKERLSGVKTFRIPFTFCIPPFAEQITRDAFEDLIATFINKTRSLVLKAVREAGIQPDDIDRVLLEGGSSQMPWVKEMLLSIFNDENKIYVSERPALDISLGATYYAAMKMGLLAHPDISSENYTVEFQVTIPHDIGLEIAAGAKGERKSFFCMLRRGTPYPLAKKTHRFTLSGKNPGDMTSFDMRILERINRDDRYEDCKLIGELEITGLPERPSGKTHLNITLLAEEEGGLIKGIVEDMGFGGEYKPSGFKEIFAPERFEKTKMQGS